MNWWNELDLLGCVLVQKAHDAVGCVRVEAGGWLVQEEKGWRSDELHAYATALSLSARHASEKLCTYLTDRGGRRSALNLFLRLIGPQKLTKQASGPSTLVSAQSSRPSSWMMFFTFFSLSAMEYCCRGNRKFAENKRFSRTLRVPMRMSSWKMKKREKESVGWEQ